MGTETQPQTAQEPRAESGGPASIDGAALQAGERVVYPNQGVCLISGIEVKEIGGVKGEFLTMKREEDGATVMIPRAKVASIGLRHVAARSEVEAVLRFLASEGDDPELDWKIRHRTHADKMVGGSLLGTAEVLKGLHALALLRPLPQRERELYDAARHLLVHEVAVSLGMSACTAEDAIDVGLSPAVGTPRAAAQAQRIAAAHDAALGLEGMEGEAEVEAGETPEVAEPPPAEDAEAMVDEAPVARPPRTASARGTAKAKPAATPKTAPKAKVAARPPAKKAKPAAKAVKPKTKAGKKAKPAKRGRR